MSEAMKLSTAILAGNSFAVNAPGESVEIVQESDAEPEFLSEASPRDKPWDVHRSQADEVDRIYSSDAEFKNLGERVRWCSGTLGFAWSPERDDPSTLTLKLKAARFCRVRHCPICQWRRSLMWVARFLTALPAVLERHPTSRFLFLTLTQRNVPILELRSTLRLMNKAWERFRHLKDFSIVQGWIRTTEVTRAEDDTAHPHFHVLLMVPSNYFTKNYITQAVWTELWKKALRVDYNPIVDVRGVKKVGESLAGAVRETLKYSVKPSDMMAHADWFLEATRQLHKLRFVASGGVLKDILKAEGEETEEDLLLLGSGDKEGPSVFFDWIKPVKRYRRQRTIAVN